MSHTPGPWSLDPGSPDGTWIWGPKDELVAYIPDEGDKGNAMLVVAAPDLLEALQKLTVEIEATGDWGPPTLWDAVDAANVVIAKTKGES